MIVHFFNKVQLNIFRLYLFRLNNSKILGGIEFKSSHEYINIKNYFLESMIF